MLIGDGNSAQLQLVFDFLNALETNDLEKISSFLSEDFQEYLFPESFKMSGILREPENPRSKADFLARAKKVLSSLNNLAFTVHEIVEGAGRIALHITSLAETVVVGLQYTNEFMMIFHISDNPNNGELKITAFKEMVDSLYSVKFFSELQNGVDSAKLEC